MVGRLAAFLGVLVLATSGLAAPIQLGFLPPPLEKATYSLGVFDAKSGKLARRLQEAALERDFTVGLNGLITSWDGKDDGGKPVPPGRYAARGYAVGALKISGESVRGNDWTADDESLRIVQVKTIQPNADDDGLIVTGLDPRHHELLARYGGPKTEFQRIEGHSPSTSGSPDPAVCAGKDDTTWKIEDGILSQYSKTGERLRSLVNQEGEPVPVAVAVSRNADRLYLLEEGKGWQRVRGLSWVETREEAGHPVSTWQTVFERSIHAPEATGGPKVPVEVTLAENPLAPDKPQKVHLVAVFDAAGSYLATESGLRLRRVSERANLEKAWLIQGKAPNSLSFFQSDGAAVDEFSVTGVRNLMEFDAGEIEMTATGEKPADPKAAEPPDL